MTRLLYTANRTGDIRSRSSFTRSVSSSSIPSLHNYSSVDVSRISLSNGKAVHQKQSQHHHHYLQHQQRRFSSSSSNIMSLLRDKPGRAGTPVYRSNSFGGLSVASNKRSTSMPSVLGETLRRPRVALKLPAGSHSFSKSNRVPRLPRPARALMVFESVKRGIREFIEATQEDIGYLMAAGSANTSTAQHLKAAKRYLKRLEFQLAKIDELHERYLLNQQLREGARNMAKAFIASGSLNRKESIASIKCGYKECSQIMCAIEAQLETMLGTLSCRLKGIAGFARMVPGDVFEAVIKHGTQKWKTKCRIEKNNTQHWDVPDFTFKCLVGEMLNIKVSEIRALKSVRLGRKNCEICNPSKRDPTNQGLFSANPQLMTVSINVQGSLKLSVVVTWNPLDGTDELVTFCEPPSQAASLAVRRQHGAPRTASGSSFGSGLDIMSGLSPVQCLKQQDDSGIYGSATSLPSCMTSESGRQSRSLSADGNFWTADPHTGRFRPHSIVVSDMSSRMPKSTSSTSDILSSSRPHSTYISSPSESLIASSSSLSSPMLSSSITSSAVTREVAQNMVPGVEVLSVVPHDSNLTVDAAMESLVRTLEDFRGHYPELQKLEEMVQVIGFLVKKTSTMRSRSSSESVSIEGAIEEAFHFLSTEDVLDDEEDESETEEGDKMKSQEPDIDQMTVSPSSTAKTADSGIGSLAKRLQKDTHFDSSVGSSPVLSSTGSEQVDHALVFHLSYCDKLLENLGNFGPLKCREKYALECLQKQAEILDKLVQIAKAGSEVDLHAVLSEETSDKILRELWVLSVDQTPLYAQPGKVVSMLEHKFGAKLAEKYKIRPNRIFQQLMARLMYVPAYEPDAGSTSIITLHQFIRFFRNGDGLTKLEELAEELHLLDCLNSSTSETAISAVLSPQEGLPPPVCLKMLTKLLVSSTHQGQQSATSYLRAVCKDKLQRDKAISIVVEGLEDHITEVRAGCCVAFSILEADEYIKQLVHVSQSDLSSTVRRKAKEALYSFGDTGRKAVEEAHLSSLGFQGHQMLKV